MAGPQRATQRDAARVTQCNRIICWCRLGRPISRRSNLYKSRGGAGACSRPLQPCTHRRLVLQRPTSIAQPRLSRGGCGTRCSSGCAGIAVWCVVALVAIAIWLCGTAVARRVDADAAACASTDGDVGGVGRPSRMQQRVQADAASCVRGDPHAGIAVERHSVTVVIASIGCINCNSVSNRSTDTERRSRECSHRRRCRASTGSCRRRSSRRVWL